MQCYLRVFLYFLAVSLARPFFSIADYLRRGELAVFRLSSRVWPYLSLGLSSQAQYLPGYVVVVYDGIVSWSLQSLLLKFSSLKYLGPRSGVVQYRVGGIV